MLGEVVRRAHRVTLRVRKLAARSLDDSSPVRAAASTPCCESRGRSSLLSCILCTAAPREPHSCSMCQTRGFERIGFPRIDSTDTREQIMSRISIGRLLSPYLHRQPELITFVRRCNLLRLSIRMRRAVQRAANASRISSSDASRRGISFANFVVSSAEDLLNKTEAFCTSEARLLRIANRPATVPKIETHFGMDFMHATEKTWSFPEQGVDIPDLRKNREGLLAHALPTSLFRSSASSGV